MRQPKEQKSPACQFYVQDFLIGTSHFSAEETGAYIRLLCYQWDTGLVENDEQKLKKISGISVKKLEKILKKFSKTKDGHYKNLRLERERQKQIDLRKRRSEAGKRGNEIKYGSRKAIAKRPQSDRKDIALQSSSSSSTSVIEGIPAGAEEYYRIFRNCCPASIPDQTVKAELWKFLDRYKDVPANKSGPLINTWVTNLTSDMRMPEHQNPKKNKNAFV
jgi:uncharacterized protein YdaU (DUF1376 family)